MSRVSLARTQILVVAGALVLGACGSTPRRLAGPAAPAPAERAAPAPPGRAAEPAAPAPPGQAAAAASCGAVGPTTGAPGFGAPTQGGTGTSTAKYFGADVTRDGDSYRFITNWWGKGWVDANVSYNGTSFTVASASGTSMPDGTPIGYPTTYCGRYSENAAHGNCGLPAAYSTIDTLWTGWKWSASDRGQYNAAWDIWLGTASAFQSYLMVWLRDPPGRQPAGNSVINNVTVAGVPGTWNIRYGTVNSQADRQLRARRRARRLRVRVQRHGLHQRRADAQRHDDRADATGRHRARRGGRIRVLDRAVHDRHVGRLLRRADDEVGARLCPTTTAMPTPAAWKFGRLGGGRDGFDGRGPVIEGRNLRTLRRFRTLRHSSGYARVVLLQRLRNICVRHGGCMAGPHGSPDSSPSLRPLGHVRFADGPRWLVPRRRRL